MMIGFIPSASQTFEIYGDFDSPELIEGKLYYRTTDGRLFYYSKIETRANPRTGWFPIWDGNNIYLSNFAIVKFFEQDAIKSDIDLMAKSIDKDTADLVRYIQRRSDNDELLSPTISDDDNMFTQCIKGVIRNKKLTMVDLIDMGKPELDEKVMDNYYNALTKIAFMRLDKWTIWINVILKLHYVLQVSRGNKLLLTYYYPDDTLDTGVVKYDSAIRGDEDPFKKIIKVLMVMENINKNTLKCAEVDDYTINNMMTTLNGNKSLSAQLFSRFIRMAKLSYTITLYELDDTQIFEFKE